jgi:hypothetical protein|nr:MAG TPA: hypothetical protein [Caudoviricetes sp.]
MTDPIRQEILDAHKTLEYLIKNLYDIPLEEAKHTTSYERLAKFLPPKPLLTMNDIKWDDNEHFLAEAEHPDWGKVAMLRESGLIIFVQPIEKKIGDIQVARVEELTPTGKRYTLTEVQE